MAPRALLVLLFLAPLSAQTPGVTSTVLLEGAVKSVATSPHGVEFRVLGQTCLITSQTVVVSPTANLTLAQLLDPLPLPGLTQPGFVGSTAIVEGTLDSHASLVRVSTLHIEPAENVLVGVVTQNGAGQLTVNRVKVENCRDARLPARPARNTFDFEIDLATAPLGTRVSLEGYFDGVVFHSHTTTVDGPALLLDRSPQVSVRRASARENTPNHQQGDDVDVRGAVTMSHASATTTTQQLEVWRIDGPSTTLLGTVIASRDADQPDFGTYRLQLTTAPSSDPVLGLAPTRLRVVNVSQGANNATTTIDVVAQ